MHGGRGKDFSMKGGKPSCRIYMSDLVRVFTSRVERSTELFDLRGDCHDLVAFPRKTIIFSGRIVTDALIVISIIDYF